MDARLRWVVVFAALPLAGWAGVAHGQETPTPPRPELSLSFARDVLRERSYDLQVASQALEQVRLVEDRATAAILPSLSLDAAYTFRDREILFQRLADVR